MAINWVGLGTIIRRELSRLMRVPTQAFIAPWISALMFIFVFGYIVGGRIATIGGHRYIEFVLPGILMMNVVSSAFLQASSQIYFQRFMRYIEEALVAPFSYVEMIVGLLAMTVVRSVITAVGILIIGILFGAWHSNPILDRVATRTLRYPAADRVARRQMLVVPHVIPVVRQGLDR